MRKFKTLLWATCCVALPHFSFAQFNLNQGADLYPDTPQIDCNSVMPEGNSDKNMDFIKKWAAFVSKKAFTLPYNNTEAYLETIRTCFSPEGWDEFSKALNKSGNIALIKAKQYQSSSQVVGMIAINHKKNSYTWETNTPIQMTYQNPGNKVTQQLIVHLKIVQTTSNHLSVTQIVGIPRQA